MTSATHQLHEDEPRPRTAQELHEQWVFFSDPAYEQGSQRQHTLGVRACLLWVMGKRLQSPVTGQTYRRPPSMDEISAEAEAAYEGMSASTPRGRQWHDQLGAGFLQGCENALTWAARLGDDEDWGI